MSPEEVAAMGAIVTSLLYLAISLALVGLVGRALSRSGRAFLRERFGGQDGVAEAGNRLLVVAFYLLSASFLALTWPAWAHVGSPGRALQLLSVKLGELLLVLGALHLTGTAVFARLRRGGSAGPLPTDAGSLPAMPSGSGSGSGSGSAGPPGSPAEHPAGASTGSPSAVPAAPWLPRPRRVVH
jgi:hypothetical protein